MEFTIEELDIMYSSLSRNFIFYEKQADCLLSEGDREKIKAKSDAINKLYAKLYDWEIKNFGLRNLELDSDK